jgi:hypothetical protein
MKKLRALLTKINDAIRPPHVGPRQSTSITMLGGNVNPDTAGDVAGGESNASAQFTVGPK